MNQRLLVIASFATLAWPLLHFGAACGDDHSHGGGGSGGEGTGLTDVIYEGGATDEALEALLAAAVVDDAAEAAYLTSPTEGAELSASTPPTFAWRVGPAPAGRAPVPERVVPERHALLPSGSHVGAPTFAEELAALLGPARAAHAHGTPVNGRGYLLVIEDESGAEVHRVFTLDLEHTPTQAAWEALAQPGGTFRASVLNAVFENNRVAEDGGPWQGPAVTFSLAP